MSDVTVPEYTVLAVISVVATVAFERYVVGSGIFRSAQYWISMAIVGFFQILVDGWLTKLSAPIVLYSPDHMLGLRFPWDIPVEDFLFGFSMVTGTILLWIRAGRRGSSGARTTKTSTTEPTTTEPSTSDTTTTDTTTTPRTESSGHR